MRVRRFGGGEANRKFTDANAVGDILGDVGFGLVVVAGQRNIQMRHALQQRIAIGPPPFGALVEQLVDAGVNFRLAEAAVLFLKKRIKKPLSGYRRLYE